MLSLASRFIMLNFLLGFAQIDAQDIPAGVMPNKRQAVGTGATTTTSTTPTTSSSSAPTTSSSSSVSTNGNQVSTSSSTSPTTVQVTTTNSDGSTVTSSISTNTVVAASSNTAVVQTQSGTKNSVVKVGSTTIDPATLSHKTVITSALIGKHTEQSTFTSLYTSDGQVYSRLVTSNVVESSTTGYATATIAPSLANGGGNGSNLSTNTKAVIGGVVGGIGGAILIGGLAFVAWRLWGRKKNQANADEYDGSAGSSINREKRGSNMTFDTEPYHTPGRSVNTASNF